MKVISNQLSVISPRHQRLPWHHRLISALRPLRLRSGPSALSSGFTLIELMAVVAIIAILFSIVLGISGLILRRSANERARTEIKMLELAIENFNLDNGQYPTTSVVRTSGNGLAEATNSWLLYTQLTSASKNYLSGFSPNPIRVPAGLTNLVCIVDPFGKPFTYYRNPLVARVVDNIAATETGGQTNRVTYDLFSYGPDGATFINGAASPPWPPAFTTPISSLDDITNWK